MGIESAQSGAHHQWVWFTNGVGLDTCSRANQCGYSPSRGNDASLTGSHLIGVGCDETCTGSNEANGPGDVLKAIRGGLSQHHMLLLLIGQNVADVMQCCC